MEITRIETSARMSRIVMHGNTIYLCGQVANDTSGDIRAQTASVLEKIDHLLTSVNSDKSRLLSATVYLPNMEHFGAMNEVWDAWVPVGHAPARACVEARLAKPEYLVEISVIAAG